LQSSGLLFCAVLWLYASVLEEHAPQSWALLLWNIAKPENNHMYSHCPGNLKFYRITTHKFTQSIILKSV
jgi:hypothetical protein